MATGDPFFAVKEEVEQNIASAETLFQSWTRIYSTVSSRDNEELQRTEEEINSFVEVTKHRVQEIGLTLSDPPAQSRDNAKNQRQELFESRQIFSIDNYSSRSRIEEVELDNTRFIENEALQQTILVQEQDEQLDSLYGTARNIHAIATTMGTEIEDQNM
ncbi:13681_t:CDS:2 [Ambispora gerdemannii]|uniref:13681_t:CDS:1 n=1 Tax=Ambispora gerdemannii TaxID=144530 RepID=A0A9N8YRY8_9GLOM|nr:13681_t:CDS:2 [Ambispora gerdemannii]